MYAPAMPFHYPSHVMAPAMYGQHAPAPTDSNTQHLTHLAADIKACIDKLEQKEAAKRGQEVQGLQEALAELRNEIRENKMPLAMFSPAPPADGTRRTCFGCGQLGHVKHNCPQNQPSNQRQGAGMQNQGQQRAAQHQHQQQPGNACVLCHTVCGAASPWECQIVCRSCGGPRHRTSQCPAAGSHCDRCNKPGHYTNLCIRDLQRAQRPPQPVRPTMQQGQQMRHYAQPARQPPNEQAQPAMRQGQRAPEQQHHVMQQPPVMQQQYGASYGLQPVHAQQQPVQPMMMAPAQPFMQQHTPPAFNPNAAAQGPYMNPNRASMIQAPAR